ncbi:hypothetical protein GIY62_20810 [Burkholderia plantarii]|uniref:hypothetical protein n=1 Tax=Burkholderia plantarii TaxID=41899 RepID=UPI00272A6632|nr:hypothetical protein [Burkholderia plantarii]WLE62825.1 hypothetical protein GIY62_20810 [Burkholderia plantarii]
MQKRFTEGQIIGFLREAEAGLLVKALWPTVRPSRSAARPDFSPVATAAWITFRLSSSRIVMVIVPVAFMTSAPQAMLAASLNSQTRHFNLARSGHYNLAATMHVVAISRCRGDS